MDSSVQAACSQISWTCGIVEASVGTIGKPPASVTPPSSKPIKVETYEGGHSLRHSSVWVREGGKLFRRSRETELSHSGKGGEGPAARFLWKRKGYELSQEAERPAYDKPLSARNQQVLMALINQEHNAESVGKLMDAWRKELGMGSLISILKELGRLREHELMQQVFDWAKATPEECQLRPQIGAYTTVLAAYTRCAMMTSADALVEDMVTSGITPDLMVYNSLLGGFARQGLFVDAMRLVTRLKAEGFQPDAATYKELIAACARGGSLADILRLFAEMKEAGVRADYFTYRTALDAFVRTVNWDGIIVLYEELVAQGYVPDRHVCNQILRAYEKKGLPERAEEVFRVMRAQNIPFTNADYGNLILAYVNVGRLEEAEGVLQDMRARNLQPELSTYNTLLDGYGRQGRYEEAESVLADMKQVGVRPQPETFQKLMMAYTRGGHCRWAESVHADMQKDGYAPTVMTYTMLIDAYGKAGSLEELLRLVEEMQSRGVPPNRATYNCLISAYCKTGHFDLAQDVLLEMTTRGHMPDDSTYYGIVDAYRKGPVGDCVLGIYKEALRLGSPPSHRLSFALIEKLASERQYDKAERIVSADQPPYKRPAAYAECMLVYASHGMSGYACKLLERFHPDGVNNLAVYNALITIAGQEKRPAEVASLFTQLQERCGAISYGTVLALLEGYAAQGAWEEVPRVVQLFHEKCKREHGRLTQKAFALLFEALGRGGRLAEISAYYAEMNDARVRKTLSCYSAVLLGLKGRLHHPDAHRVWEVLEGFRLPVHKVIRNILSDRKQEGSWDLSLQQALERVPGGARESLLYKRGFFNALLDILWAESKCRHAANVVAVALRKGVYLPGKRTLPLKPGVAAPVGSSTGHVEGGELSRGDPPEWWVDLRHTSPGAACAILRGWLLGDAREGVANVEAGLAELPEKVELYFGRTVEEGATYQEGAEPPHLASFLAVKELVAELGLPFRGVEGDTAILAVPASEFREWILETEGSHEMARASGELRRASEEFRREVPDPESGGRSLESEGGTERNGTASGAGIGARLVGQDGADYGAGRRGFEGIRRIDGTAEPEGNERLTDAVGGTSIADGSPRPRADRDSVPLLTIPETVEDARERETASHSLDEIVGMLTSTAVSSVTDSMDREFETKDRDSAHIVEQRRGEEETTGLPIEAVAEKPEVLRKQSKAASRATPFVRLSLKREKVGAQ
ncbi:putative Pentatricopeptide repeat domain containing protein [Klebsormidium nitens]|uniref:Putative Pentatricopeptide repeat domain containing protein n=1 Tax=Klebsormidium nitens TaxID=105231 RepID=A0A1Y1HQN9_KLENI|nr:putative Pentatricopeptide repeat domain containing protein [Klebsormidium nitens]|eukprot:GAQ78877.1 putative Pentatricopeptide repeat domain containing protein [Klebsormidium nitens]